MADRTDAKRGGTADRGGTAGRSYATDREDGSPRPAMESCVVFACEMIEDEVNSAMDRVWGSQSQPRGRRSAGRPPIVWIESGLHEVPRRLRDHIQGLVDLVDEGASQGHSAELPTVRPGRGPGRDRMGTIEIPPVDQIILALGYCGNGLEGVVSQETVIAFPRVDDCISLFLNHGCPREDIERDARAFYLTGGWLTHDNPVQESWDCLKKRFGAERAAELTRASMASYERVTLIDTTAFDTDAFLPRSRSFAAELHLDHTLVPGSLQLLERLFAGPWDSEIVAVAPGVPITIWHLFEPGAGPHA